ncbi:uncharacterized protein PV07_10199 [Cladophialophora immunda]|uniref:Uncharacterized protein n=1 Tax=Cladophialophora immunda TaxID=569365 RepID=A0A0D2BZI7_9EURO|nr:uncharacterized protein PV07_10199 [Cladophialophora immunda]KIW24488.1 hypothetical protein PV07_10199 [Cladophialophora immunda]
MVAVFLLFNIESPSREKLNVVAQLKFLDPIGIFFFIPSIVCLMLGLQWGGSTYSWSAPTITCLFVTFGALFIIFVVVEIKTPETAMAPMRVVLNRSVAGSILYMFLASGGVMILIFYLPYWFQAIQNISATQAGIRTLPLILPFFVSWHRRCRIYTDDPHLCSDNVVRASTFRDWGWTAFNSVTGVRTRQMDRISALVRLRDWLWIPECAVGSAQLGGSIYLAVGQNVLSSSLVHDLRGVARVDAQDIIETGATDLRHLVTSDKLDAGISVYSHALTRVFLVAAVTTAVMAVGAFMVEWKEIKEKPTEQRRPSGQQSDIELYTRREPHVKYVGILQRGTVILTTHGRVDIECDFTPKMNGG